MQSQEIIRNLSLRLDRLINSYVHFQNAQITKNIG